MASAAQIAANRINAALSTGPRTEEGKLASSGNNRKFGFTGKDFRVLACEDQAEFDSFRQQLLDEHQPQTLTEELLVQRMAQHHWLAQRAILQQELCFRASGACEFPKDLALFLRYQTTHERAFHKCLQELRNSRAERAKEQRDEAALSQRAEAANKAFEAQREKQLAQFHRAKAEARKDELHEARMQLLALSIQKNKLASNGKTAQPVGHNQPPDTNPNCELVRTAPPESRTL